MHKLLHQPSGPNNSTGAVGAEDTLWLGPARAGEGSLLWVFSALP